jgi:putative ABC transport system ATP-binding protein
LILADEPTGNLSSLQSEEIMQIFQELNEDGGTIVMVTHEPDIGRHCRRMVQIRDGRVMEDEPVRARLWATDVLVRMANEKKCQAVDTAAAKPQTSPSPAGALRP